MKMTLPIGLASALLFLCAPSAQSAFVLNIYETADNRPPSEDEDAAPAPPW